MRRPETALAAYRAIGCSGIARVDLLNRFQGPKRYILMKSIRCPAACTPITGREPASATWSLSKDWSGLPKKGGKSAKN